MNSRQGDLKPEAPQALRLIFGDWASLSKDAQIVRLEVFVHEQHVPPEIEMDDMDAVCLHALAYDGAGQLLGTGRLLPDGHIGRMAVRKSARGSGVGGALLEGLMEKARGRGDAGVVLNAQTHAAPFYARHGFVQEGGEFEEAGIAHVQMRVVFG
jgi:predicted GNAT family N-acyltransferase